MYGVGILKGLSVTFKHFINTYLDDIRFGCASSPDSKISRNGRVWTQEAFTPFSIPTRKSPCRNASASSRFWWWMTRIILSAPVMTGVQSCGICAKVCPPQCIWIVRGEDPVTKRPCQNRKPFFIDIDICMNCGYCAEFCPFDAIKMDHDYELASYDRTWKHIYDKEKLSKPFSYWASIAPTTALEEADARGGWEHPDMIKEFKKTGGTPTPVTEPWQAMKTHAAERVKSAAASEVASNEAEPRAQTAETSAPAASMGEDAEAAAKAERLRKREEALARKRAREQGGE